MTEMARACWFKVLLLAARRLGLSPQVSASDNAGHATAIVFAVDAEHAVCALWGTAASGAVEQWFRGDEATH